MPLAPAHELQGGMQLPRGAELEVHAALLPEETSLSPQLLSKRWNLVTFAMQQYLTLPKQFALGVFPEIVRPMVDMGDIWVHYC